MSENSQVKPIGYGELAPLFAAILDTDENFIFGKLGGRWVVMQFLVRMSSDLVRDAHQVILDRSDIFDFTNAAYCGVIVDRADLAAGPLSRLPARRYIKDFSEAVTRQYGVKIKDGYMPVTILLDPMLRVVAVEPLRRTSEILDLMERRMAAERSSLTEGHAPVLTVPRIFEPEFCKKLIDYYEATGGEASGFMRQVGGTTMAVHDDKVKRRKDVTITDEAIRNGTIARIRQRLLPVIERAYGWRATRIERYIVACYDAEDAGFFTTHRDNTTSATAHRKFAVSINLNAEDFDGGELRFPEFGYRTYKPPTGGATVFGCGLLHEATPVTRGVRYAFLPFLYDEESARIRTDYLNAKASETPATAGGVSPDFATLS